MEHPYQYIKADEFIMVNTDDPDLVPIKIMLPEPPPFEETLGYGLAPKDQKWERLVPSNKLLDLMKDPTMVPSQKVEFLEENHTYFTNEIEFIIKDWEYTQEGLWIFIKGKQYYISGTNYLWLQAGKFQISRLEIMGF